MEDRPGLSLKLVCDCFPFDCFSSLGLKVCIRRRAPKGG